MILLVVTLLNLGLHRPAGLLLLQHGRGLRPREVLRLRRKDVVGPEAADAGGAGVLLLGTRTGTKSKRPQPVRVSVLTELFHAEVVDVPF